MNNIFNKIATATLLIVLLSGCTYVRLSSAGQKVTQAQPADVLNCETVGIVTAQTAAKVVIKRAAGQVSEELIVLARNQAADLGANAIVPIALVKNGGQSFNAYRCEGSR